MADILSIPELKALISDCLRNKRKSQEKLYKIHFDVVYFQCMKYAKDEDEALLLVNDTFLKVFKNISRFRYEGSFEGWIRKICFRIIADHYRKAKRKAKVIDLSVIYDQGVPSQANSDLYYEDLLDAVSELPDTAQKVFELHAIYGYKHREIGEMLGISDGTSKWYLHQARAQLKEILNRLKRVNAYAG